MNHTSVAMIAPAAHIFANKIRAAQAAAQAAAATLRACVEAKGRARIMVGTGNSQLDMIRFLVAEHGIDWSSVEAFHLDEYVGLPANHPASFRLWMRTRFVEQVRPKVTHYIEGDAADLEGMMAEYGRRLTADTVDLAFVGIGENGHIAFNDPHVADFEDPRPVRRVMLDENCRRQQVGEGHFPDLESVPREAITVSCTGLFRAETWICCVPDRRKAHAVKHSLEGRLSTSCPGSMVQQHPAASLFLDAESAGFLSPAYVKSRCHVHYANLPVTR